MDTREGIQLFLVGERSQWTGLKEVEGREQVTKEKWKHFKSAGYKEVGGTHQI